MTARPRPPERPEPDDDARFEALKADPFLAKHRELEAGGTFEECPLHWLIAYADRLMGDRDRLAARLEEFQAKHREIVDRLVDRLGAERAAREAAETQIGTLDQTLREIHDAFVNFSENVDKPWLRAVDSRVMDARAELVLVRAALSAAREHGDGEGE